AFADDMLRKLHERGITHDVPQQPLAVLERYLEEPLAVEVDDVEDDVLHRVLFRAAVLQKLEGRPALLVEGNDLPIQDRLPGADQLADGLQLRILVVDGSAGTGLESDLPVLDEADQADPVPLDLEQPALVVERLV